jgi:hypothetical protein
MKKILLAIVSLGSVTFAHAQSTACSELFFSEYVEGTSHSKALEIYNPTASPIALSNYEIIRFSNGSPTPVDSLQLTGTVAANDVWVVVNGQATPDQNGAFCDPALAAMGDQVGPSQYVTGTAVMYFNGDDALVLVKKSPRTFVDIFGKIGEQPVPCWSDQFPYTGAGAWWTKDHTLIRKSTVTGGVTVNPTAFNVTTEWDSLPVNTWTNLGMHTSTCAASGILENGKNNSTVTAFPNPSNGMFTLTSASAIKSVDVYNTLGELIFTKRFSASEIEQQLDLSSQSSGIYFMQVELANGQRVDSKISIR